MKKYIKLIFAFAFAFSFMIIVNASNKIFVQYELSYLNDSLIPSLKYDVTNNLPYNILKTLNCECYPEIQNGNHNVSLFNGMGINGTLNDHKTINNEITSSFKLVRNGIIIARDWKSSLSSGMLKIIDILKFFYDILIILIPISLLLFGTVDLLKAVAAQDEKMISAATSSLGRRALWAVVAILGMIIIKAILFFFDGGNDWTSYW